jgi:hypothetical protein
MARLAPEHATFSGARRFRHAWSDATRCCRLMSPQTDSRHLYGALLNPEP